jgi:hypothetical protein
VEGERVGSETEWIGLRSGRHSAVSTSVGTRANRQQVLCLAPQRGRERRHRENPSGIAREAIAWGSDESFVLSRPAEPGASSSSASARFDSSFADFWFVASCVGPFAEAGARYRVAPSFATMADPKGSVATWTGAQQESRHASAGRSGGVSNHAGCTWSRRGCSSRGAETGCRAPLHTHPWHDERTRLSPERRVELETGA